MTKTRRETDNAKNTQYSICHDGLALAQYRLDGLAPRLHESVEAGDRVSCKDDMPSENKCESLHSNPILNMSCLCCFFNVCLVFFPRSTDYRRDWRPYTLATDGARNALKV